MSSDAAGARSIYIVRSVCLIVVFLSTISLLTFCLKNLPIVESRILKPPIELYYYLFFLQSVNFVLYI